MLSGSRSGGLVIINTTITGSTVNIIDNMNIITITISIISAIDVITMLVKRGQGYNPQAVVKYRAPSALQKAQHIYIYIYIALVKFHAPSGLPKAGGLLSTHNDSNIYIYIYIYYYSNTDILL